MMRDELFVFVKSRSSNTQKDIRSEVYLEPCHMIPRVHPRGELR